MNDFPISCNTFYKFTDNCETDGNENRVLKYLIKLI